MGRRPHLVQDCLRLVDDVFRQAGNDGDSFASGEPGGRELRLVLARNRGLPAWIGSSIRALKTANRVDLAGSGQRGGYRIHRNLPAVSGDVQVQLVGVGKSVGHTREPILDHIGVHPRDGAVGITDSYDEVRRLGLRFHSGRRVGFWTAHGDLRYGGHTFPADRGVGRGIEALHLRFVQRKPHGNDAVNAVTNRAAKVVFDGFGDRHRPIVVQVYLGVKVTNSLGALCGKSWCARGGVRRQRQERHDDAQGRHPEFHHSGRTPRPDIPECAHVATPHQRTPFTCRDMP
jgi:hypothetical protein